MKKQYRWLALAVSCILACSMPVSAVCGEAEAPAGAGDTEAAAEAAAEEWAEEPEEDIEEDIEEPGGTEAEGPGTWEESAEDTAEDEGWAEEGPAAEEAPADEAEAEEEAAETSGYCGDGLTWEYGDGALYIKGTGDMYDYDREGRPGWDVYADLIEELHIEKGITLVDGDAFEGMEQLRDVYYGGSREGWEALPYEGEKEKEEAFSGDITWHFEEQGLPEDTEGPAEEERPAAEEAAEEETSEPAGASDGLGFITEPSDVSAAAGETITFHAEANRDDVFYQWQWSKTGTTWTDCTYTGADTDTFSFAMKETLNGRLYRCLIYTEDDEAVSAAARAILATAEPLEITEQPADASAGAGEAITFHVGTNKTNAAFQWQWSKNGTTWTDCTYTGADTDTFSFTMKSTLNGRLYRCIVSSGSEQIVSEAARTVFQTEPLEITEQPEDASAGAGELITFHVAANKADAGYQWQWSKNGTTWTDCTYTGADTDTFSFTMKSTLNGRLYRCVVSSGSQQAVSEAARAVFQTEPLEITEQPSDASAAAGEAITFHVAANKADARYQWQWKSRTGKTWTDCTYTGANTDTFSFTMKSTLDGRLYRCVVSSGSQQVISDAATATFQAEPLEITEQPEDVSAVVWEAVSFHVAASKAGASYQWQWSSNGTDWTDGDEGGSDTDTLGLTMEEELDGRMYRCVVTSGKESIPSEHASATLVVIDGVIYGLADGAMAAVGYRGNAQEVTVQETVKGQTVTRIGESAFEGRTTIRTMHLPDTIEVIGKRAFAGCSGLTNMD